MNHVSTLPQGMADWGWDSGAECTYPTLLLGKYWATGKSWDTTLGVEKLSWW